MKGATLVGVIDSTGSALMGSSPAGNSTHQENQSWAFESKYVLLGDFPCSVYRSGP
jgi:hypothetical protein